MERPQRVECESTTKCPPNVVHCFAKQQLSARAAPAAGQTDSGRVPWLGCRTAAAPTLCSCSSIFSARSASKAQRLDTCSGSSAMAQKLRPAQRGRRRRRQLGAAGALSAAAHRCVCKPVRASPCIDLQGAGRRSACSRGERKRGHHHVLPTAAINSFHTRGCELCQPADRRGRTCCCGVRPSRASAPQWGCGL